MMPDGSALLPPQIYAHIEALLLSEPTADRIAVVWPEALSADAYRFSIEGQSIRCQWCVSELAIREQLVLHKDPAERLVLISNLDSQRLAADVRARIWQHEARYIRPRDTLKQLLGVNEIDPRLSGKDKRWLLEELVKHHDRYRQQVRFGTVLDLESAWQAMGVTFLGLSEGQPDLHALLRWSLDASAPARLGDIPQPMLENLNEWLKPRLDALAPVVAALWATGNAPDLIGVGLVCALLYSPGHEKDPKVHGVRGKFDLTYFEEHGFDRQVIHDFGQGCADFVARELAEGRRSVLGGAFTTAEQLLASHDLEHLATESNLLPLAYRQRLDEFATALNASLSGKNLARTHSAMKALQAHQLASSRREQVAHAVLAVHACSWLSTHTDPPTELSRLVGEYVRSGGFLDWVRSRVWEGDEHEALSDTYEDLGARLRKRSEAWNKAFAEHLETVADGGMSIPGVTRVEDALSQLIAPMLTDMPVLLLVVDGMSQAVYRELADDLLNHHWIELQRESTDGPECLLAALPSITRVSRFALLAGELGEGTSSAEKKAFEDHAGLKAGRARQVLFHKAELLQAGGGGLAGTVRDTIANRDQKLVAAVVNAVDDQLSSNAQLSVRWSINQIGVLRQLLEAAASAGRTVVLTSDHGHVLDHDMTAEAIEGANERARSDARPAGTGEKLVSGQRVCAPQNRMVLPWSERPRYTQNKKMGYHGGASLQEVVIPFGVFRNSRLGEAIPDWKEVPRQMPDWWRLEDFPGSDGGRSSAPSEADLSQPASKPMPGDVKDLFAEPSQTPPTDDWIDRLLASDVYRQMQSRAGRAAINDEQMRALLDVLMREEGQAMLPRLAQGLDLPALRLKGFLAGARKLLNVDGYLVLSQDRASQTVKLNLDLLRKQFEL